MPWGRAGFHQRAPIHAGVQTPAETRGTSAEAGAECQCQTGCGMRSGIDFTGGNHVDEGGPADQLMRPADRGAEAVWGKIGRGRKGAEGRGSGNTHLNKFHSYI